MSTYSQIADAMLLFKELEGDHHGVSAEHDVIYAGRGIDKMTDEQKANLEAWGWYYDEDAESWSCYF